VAVASDIPDRSRAQPPRWAQGRGTGVVVRGNRGPRGVRWLSGPGRRAGGRRGSARRPRAARR
jgi:hypothetical protein